MSVGVNLTVTFVAPIALPVNVTVIVALPPAVTVVLVGLTAIIVDLSKDNSNLPATLAVSLNV